MTQLLYVLILLVALLLGYLEQKREKKLYLYLLIALLTFAAGFRGINCGVDTPSYYESISKGFPYHWKFREEGFRLVANFFMETFNNPQVMFVFCAFVTNSLILLRLWDYRKDADFGFMTLLYILLYYSNSMNIMRQYVAVALLFYGSRFLKQNRIAFIPFIVGAYFFHRSSLVAVGFLIISFWSDSSKKQKKIFFLPIVLVALIVVGFVASSLSSDITAYSSLAIKNLNITYFYLLTITIFVIVAHKCKFNVIISGLKKTKYKKYTIGTDLIIYTLIGLGFSAMSMFFSFVGRIGLYYSIYDMVFWGIACKKNRNAQINKVLILIYAFYVFGLVLFRNDGLIFPYSIYFY